MNNEFNRVRRGFRRGPGEIPHPLIGAVVLMGPPIVQKLRLACVFKGHDPISCDGEAKTTLVIFFMFRNRTFHRDGKIVRRVRFKGGWKPVNRYEGIFGITAMAGATLIAEASNTGWNAGKTWNGKKHDHQSDSDDGRTQAYDPHVPQPNPIRPPL